MKGFIKKIKQINFGLMSPEDIREMSVVKIETPDTYDEDGYPIENGLMDPHLGVIDPSLKCRSCGYRGGECQGHFGSIELARPVIHVGFGDIIHKILSSTCNECGRVLLNDDEILNRSYEILEEKEMITEEELINILEQVNGYKLVNENIQDTISPIVKIFNSTYRINKLNTIWKHKEASNKKILANQLGGVSKVISSLADDIKTEEKTEKPVEKKYKLIIGAAETTKNKSEVSGDSNIRTKLHDGKYMLAISDGMGSGPRAKKSSTTVIQMLKRLLTTGFDNDVSIGLINSAVNLNSNDETYATIDISIIDLSSGNIELVKNGACPTFIKSGKKVETIKAISFPAGVLDKIDLVVYDKDLKENDIIVMCSDGIIESNTEYKNKELWLKELMENIETDDVQKIADIIMQEAIDNGFGIAKDDMTVIVTKLVSI